MNLKFPSLISSSRFISPENLDQRKFAGKKGSVWINIFQNFLFRKYDTCIFFMSVFDILTDMQQQQ